MTAQQKLRELPGLLLFLIILSGSIALICGWRRITLDSYGAEDIYGLRLQLWLAVTGVLLVLRLAVVRIIAAMDAKP